MSEFILKAFSIAAMIFFVAFIVMLALGVAGVSVSFWHSVFFVYVVRVAYRFLRFNPDKAFVGAMKQ